MPEKKSPEFKNVKINDKRDVPVNKIGTLKAGSVVRLPASAANQLIKLGWAAETNEKPKNPDVESDERNVNQAAAAGS